MTHRYAAGDAVAYRPKAGTSAARGAYHIVRTLPADQAGEVSYRIKGDQEGFERIATEDQLQRLPGEASSAPAAEERRTVSLLAPIRPRVRIGR